MLRTYGNPKAVPLVLLHGFSFNGDMWSNWCAELQHQFYLLVPDLPGYDPSDATISVDIAQDTEVLLKYLPSSACYLGWSLGGLFAMWIATHYPNRVRCAITTGSTPCFSMRPNWGAGMSDGDLNKFRAIATTGTRETILRRLVALVVQGDESPLYWQKKIRHLAHFADKATLESGLNILRDTDLRKVLAQSLVSMMHIVGENDAMLSSRLTHALGALTSEKQVVAIPDTGHGLPWTRQSQAIALTRQFIAENVQ